MKNRLAYKAATILAVLIVGSSIAFSTPTLTISDGITTKIITDGGFFDSNMLSGVVQFNGSIGNWFINVDTGITKPAADIAPEAPSMDLSFVDSAWGAGSLTIRFSEDNWGPVSMPSLMSTIGGTFAPGMTGLYNVYQGNALLTSISLSGSSYSGTASADILPSENPFSLTQELILTSTQYGWHTASGNASLAAVPEPSALILLGSGLLALGGLRLRKKS
jgi:hypothetical protein